MKKTRINKAVECVVPYGELLGDVVQTASRNVRDAVRLLGLPRPVERSGDMHRAIRCTFAQLCPLTNGMFTLREGARGLDYVHIRSDVELAIRWGHEVKGKIKRNGTLRTGHMYDQAYLSDDWGLDGPIDKLPMLTIAYTWADDFTLAGQPQWYVNRLRLVRECAESIQGLHILQRFSEPAPNVWTDDLGPVVAVRDDDADRWRKKISDIRRAV